MRGTPFETRALGGVTLTVEAGEAVALAGPTGSGKSTLAQHFNGLLRPTRGRVRVAGMEIPPRGGDLLAVRAAVGLLFQFPEQQLFEETVEADVAYGPRNLGVKGEDLRERVEEALEKVGLPPGRFAHRSPFALSEGEKRRVALAGVLATRPRCLVLDEPTAGLDPRSRRELLERLECWRRDEGLTLVIISHDMDDLARVAERLVVLEAGRVAGDGPVRELFSRVDWMAERHLEVPAVCRLAARLVEAGLPLPRLPLTVEEAAEDLLTLFR